MARVLGAIRQSKTKNRSVSPAVQRRQINNWAAQAGDEVVKITEDLSTSGGISAFRRKGIGPYLTEPELIKTWDVLCVTKLDRLSRDLADFLRVDDWCKRHGKTLIVVDDPSLNTSTPQGAGMAQVRATFAEQERKLGKIRAKEKYDEVLDQGKWTGGRLPYGWRYNKKTSFLIPDEGGRADILRQMADMAIAGKSNGQIGEWLNESGNLTLIGRQWRPDTVRRVLRHEMTATLLGEAKAAELRAALRSREITSGERVGGHMLLRVAYCRISGDPLYAHIRKNRPNSAYYRCLPCKTYLPLVELETFVEKSLLRSVGDRWLRERILVPGDDHQAEIHRLEHEIDALEKISGTETVVEMKRAEVEHLKSEPFSPDHFVFKRLNIKIAAYWDALPPQDRGSFLRSWQVKVYADKDEADIDLGLLDMDNGGFPVG